MNMNDFPLVLFTVFSQAGIGLALVSAVRRFATPAGPADQSPGEWFAALALLALGMVFSLFHLGDPLRAANALKHLATSWLSREALSAGIAMACIAASAFMAKSGSGSRLMAALTAIAGVLVLFVMGMTYSPPSFPALNNALPFVFFCVTALAVGASASSLFVSAERAPLVRRILAVTLIVGLVIHLVAPCVWLSGGTVMARTGQAWLASPLFWASVALAYVIPLGVLWAKRSIPVWLPFAILAGELLGRLVFFTQTVHTASNLGGIY